MNTLTIIGLGCGDFNQLTLEAYKLLSQEHVIVRTKVHPCINSLLSRGCDLEFLDSLYEENNTFDNIYEAIVKEIQKRLEEQDVYYAVPGNPFFNEKTVEMLVEESEHHYNIRTIPGISYIDTIADSLKLDLGENTKVLDLSYFLEDSFSFDPKADLLISQVWHPYYFVEAILKLMTFYPDNTEVALIKHAGLEEEEVIWFKLSDYENFEIDHLTSLFVKKNPELKRDFSSLIGITAYLRSPEGCPWDRKQTHESLKRYLIEETYEVIDALDRGDIDNLREELGDVLFEILIHSQIASESGEFNIYDVIEGISEKMIRRHPHIFSNGTADTIEEAFKNWDEIKKEEKSITSPTELMKKISPGTPTLLISDKIQTIARKTGFDYDDPLVSMIKVVEEVGEVLDAFKNEDDVAHQKEELGDLIFAVVNVLRLAGFDSDEALRLANKKFIERFGKMEQFAREENKLLEDMDLDSQEVLWEKAKKSL